ncbi:universal stress protein [Paraburkholderia phenoliruptrix]|uniref:universal stress protein n=1 Tax=Paraburkholderia phenoliruptrix TaxID=252970 RepID=UPI001C4F776C|nr:universal stress protein [Paraburkholderia phenoliruptrix]MBW0445847.1 universal stress protein [Paraburkholderia phenoliruptrix]MBW9101701.1 universal stress protein [Paraburkholderia phenoliruptrix]
MSSSERGADGAAAIRRILIAVDASPESARAADYVCHMTLPGALIRIVSVAENPRVLLPLGSMTDAELQLARTELARDAEQAVARAKKMFADAGIEVESGVIEIARQGGYTANALIDAAAQWGADLLVLGARQHHGMMRWVEGTVSEFVTTRALCSILIVPAGYEADIGPSPQRILFALDGSVASLDALHAGCRLARSDSRLRAIYVVDRAVRLTDFVPIHVLEEAFIEEGEAAMARARSVFETLGNTAETALVKTEPVSDDVSHAIVRDAERWHADLLVLGTHGRRGVARWLLGSVAARTARLARTPVLLARPRPDA